MADLSKKADQMVLDFIQVSNECIPEIVRKNQETQHEQQSIEQTIPLNIEDELIMEVQSPSSSDIDQSPEDVLPPIKSPVDHNSRDKLSMLKK
ncbi:unnamed protein product [Adineta steineri]|uniref:Uncharacterized protein n=1 Tax=Adineta steineri TaxID=433720 RepID=A0A818VQP2_9BILA|nr:unnamed protein product [Adineta steineri]CAF0872463.1 unnamed protein product [Adineta steineri]CAF3714501.1 unnamed protein product [Adineta steineri]CAF3964078.1 unnamed protein product [Adineta steineri]